MVLTALVIPRNVGLSLQWSDGVCTWQKHLPFMHSGRRPGQALELLKMQLIVNACCSGWSA
eukprot:2206667-Amphidinium_carterae.1